MQTYPYLIQLPDAYKAEPEKRWPLILFLHGSGERGDSLPKLNAQGLPKLIAAGKKFPAIIVSPQCPEDQGWKPPLLSQLLDEVSAKYLVDSDRVVVTGISMGGFGAWALALAYPNRFSALAPICGGGDPPNAARLKELPIWGFHGDKDNAVPVELAHEMINALRKAGGRPHFTLYAGVGHDSWTPAYDTAALYSWLLAQKRGEMEIITPGVPID
jgi:predicted peptidase